MADNTTKILLLVVILAVLGYAYTQNSGVGIIGISGEPAEKAAEKIVDRDCSGTEYIVQKPCSRNGVVLDGLTDETSGAGFETQVLDKNHEGFVRQLGDGVCPPKLVECNVDPPKPCSGNTWLDALCVRLDADGNEVILEDGNADRCGDGILKQTLDTSAADYEPATKGGLCTFERSGACQKTCPEPQPPVCNYPVLGWQYNDLGCVKSQDDLSPVGCGETGVIQRYKASTMNTEYCKNLTEWVSCSMKPCPKDCEGSWSDWTPNPDACDVQPSESRIYSITNPAVGNTQFGYGRPCEEIHDKVETRSRQDPIDPCCTQNHDWAPAFSAHGGTCKPNGTGIYVQTTKGTCPDDVKSAMKSCCYESGEWEDVGECQMNGKQKQVQATNGNCLESVKTREIDCCWKNEWTDVGICNSNGEQSQSRIVAGSCEAVRYPKDPAACAEAKKAGKEGEPACELGDPVDESAMSRTVDCLYVGDWDRDYGTCNGSKRYKYRTVKNPELSLTGSPPSTVESQSCADCKGYWRQEYGHKWHARGRSNKKRHYRVRYEKYYSQQNGYNGGNTGCPSHGSTRSENTHRQKEGDMDTVNHIREYVGY